jgi:outer membrane protein TolC
VALSLSLALQPAEARTVTLEDVVRIVLERNLNVEKARQNIRRSEALLRAARGKFDWNVFADASAIRKEVPKEVDGFLSADTQTDTLYGTRIGISRTFRNGIRVSPQISIFRDADNEASELFSQSRTGAGLSLEVPLLRGAGVANAAADELARQAELRAAELSTTYQTQQLVHNAVMIYWRSLALEMSLNILLALEQEVGAFGDTVRELVEKGELAPIVLQETIADLSLRRLEINRSREALMLARGDLATALGIEIGDTFELPVATGEMPRVVALPMEAAVEKRFVDLALASRSDLASLQQRAQSEDIRRDEAENALKPKLDFLLDQNSVTLRFQKSLNENVEKGKLGTRSVAVHLAQLDLQLLRRGIRSQVGLTVNRLAHSSENYRLAAETYWLLSSVADDKQRQVVFGASQRREHISALDKLARTHRQVVDTNLQYAVGLSQLRLITGTISVDGGKDAAAIAQEFLTLPTAP